MGYVCDEFIDEAGVLPCEESTESGFFGGFYLGTVFGISMTIVLYFIFAILVN